jgi:hypothetical protein
MTVAVAEMSQHRLEDHYTSRPTRAEPARFRAIPLRPAIRPLVFLNFLAFPIATFALFSHNEPAYL